jgi:hypothetical protein
MRTKLFVGLTFYSDSHLAKKIESFKTRFDPKHKLFNKLHLSLLKPFEVEEQERKNLIEELTEEIDSFFFNVDSPKLNFFGLEMAQAKKDYVLFLNPNFDSDFVHLIESVADICKNYVAQEEKYQNSKKQMLPIARFNDGESLKTYSELAEEEFNFQSEMVISGISLFEKKQDEWIEIRELISFEKLDDSLLHSKSSQL